MEGAKQIDGFTLIGEKEFNDFVAEADSTAEWVEATRSEMFVVWSKPSSASHINVVKCLATFKNVAPEVLYDTLHDAEYRATWDENMIEGKVIQQLDPQNEVGYYSAKAPSTVANRDFVNLRAWRGNAAKGEYIICNHSVTHKDMPEKKGFVRAWSHLTGYLIRKTETGCTLCYLTQSDPRGWFPGWVINMFTTKFAPKILEKLFNASLKYPEWKKSHNPDKRPWDYTKTASP